MKIAFYIPVLNVGGAEKVIVNLLNQFVKTESDSYYLITDTSNSRWIGDISREVILIDVKSTSNIISRLFSLKNAIQDHKIDLVVSNLTHSNIHFLFLKYIFKFRLIIVEQNITSKYLDDFPNLRPLFNFLIKKMFNKADLIICVSKSTLNDLVRHFNIAPFKCKLIYNPINFETIKHAHLDEIPSFLSEKLNGRKSIVTVARLEKQKNHIFLLESISDYLKTKNILLVLVGGGSLQPIIEDKISSLGLQNHVFITGAIDNPYPIIANADVLVHPANYEGFGLVLIEAIFLGTKVISMNFEAAYEVLENGRLATIVEDKNSLLSALDSAFSTSMDTSHLKFSDEVCRKYNIENISKEYSLTFSSI